MTFVSPEPQILCGALGVRASRLAHWQDPPPPGRVLPPARSAMIPEFGSPRAGLLAKYSIQGIEWDGRILAGLPTAAGSLSTKACILLFCKKPSAAWNPEPD